MLKTSVKKLMLELKKRILKLQDYTNPSLIPIDQRCVVIIAYHLFLAVILSRHLESCLRLTRTWHHTSTSANRCQDYHWNDILGLHICIFWATDKSVAASPAEDAFTWPPFSKMSVDHFLDPKRLLHNSCLRNRDRSDANKQKKISLSSKSLAFTTTPQVFFVSQK